MTELKSTYKLLVPLALRNESTAVYLIYRLLTDSQNTGQTTRSYVPALSFADHVVTQHLLAIHRFLWRLKMKLHLSSMVSLHVVHATKYKGDWLKNSHIHHPLQRLWPERQAHRENILVSVPPVWKRETVWYRLGSNTKGARQGPY